MCYCLWYNYKVLQLKGETEGMTIFDYTYLCSAYADDTTFFLKDIISIRHMVDNFPYFSRLKPNLTKFEIVGIGVLKGVQEAVCGMCCIDLNKSMLKIFGTHFS